MSTHLKIQLSRLGVISCVTVLLFASCGIAAYAQALPDLEGTAQAIAAMNIIELFAYIALTSTGLTVLMVGVYVKTVAQAQKDASAWMATIAAGQSAIASALHDVAEKCDRKACPR